MRRESVFCKRIQQAKGLEVQKKSHIRFSDILPKRFGIFNQFFKHLLYVPFYIDDKFLFSYLQLDVVTPY